MLNKLLPRTPLGMVVTAVTVILSVSPEARRFTRQAAVKGIAGLMSLADQVRGMTASATGQMREWVQEAREPMMEGMQAMMPHESGRGQEKAPFTFDTGVEPVDINETQAERH